MEVFEGNVNDSKTLTPLIEKVRHRFGIQQVVLVGDRGVLTSAQIEKMKEIEGIDWITALRAPQIKELRLLNQNDTISRKIDRKYSRLKNFKL